MSRRHGRGDVRVGGPLGRGATANVATSETTTSTSYTDLATSGPAVTVPRGGDQLLLYKSDVSNTGASDTLISPSIAGAAAVDANAAGQQQVTPHYAATGHTVTTPTGGSTHTMKYRVGANTGTFVNRRLTAVLL